MTKEDKKIPLVEVFGPTIQGEGILIGIQTYFLRFGLCDYKCKMCDSMHAVDPRQVKANSRMLTQPEIYMALMDLHAKTPNANKWVTFSGGNPAIHDLSILVRMLRAADWNIAVETQGTFAPEWFRQCQMIVCSPKGPGMDNPEQTDLEVLDNFYLQTFLHAPLITKIVVFDQRDLEYAKMLHERYSFRGGIWFLSLGNTHPGGRDDALPHHEAMASFIARYQTLFEDIQNDPILSQFRFLPQWHWFVWGDEKGR